MITKAGMSHDQNFDSNSKNPSFGIDSFCHMIITKRNSLAVLHRLIKSSSKNQLHISSNHLVEVRTFRVGYVKKMPKTQVKLELLPIFSSSSFPLPVNTFISTLWLFVRNAQIFGNTRYNHPFKSQISTVFFSLSLPCLQNK